jgi:hypothetical protein
MKKSGHKTKKTKDEKPNEKLRKQIELSRKRRIKSKTNDGKTKRRMKNKSRDKRKQRQSTKQRPKKANRGMKRGSEGQNKCQKGNHPSISIHTPLCPQQVFFGPSLGGKKKHRR